MAASQYDKAINNYGPALEEIAKDSKKFGLQKQFVLFQWAQALALKGVRAAATDEAAKKMFVADMPYAALRDSAAWAKVVAEVGNGVLEPRLIRHWVRTHWEPTESTPQCDMYRRPR